MPASQTMRLTKLIAAVCPIDGVSVGRHWVPSTVEIQFTPSATDQQKAAAQAVVAAFDPSDEAQSAWEADQQPDKRDLRAAAANAIADLDAFLALASPSNAQTLAIVRKLCQQNRAIIKRLIQVD